MSNSNSSHQLLARAGAPTSGLDHAMSTTTTSPAAVKTSTARVVSSSTKAVQVTSTSVAPVVAKTSTSSQVRAATSSSVAPVKAPTTSTTPVIKTITPPSSSSRDCVVMFVQLTRFALLRSAIDYFYYVHVFHPYDNFFPQTHHDLYLVAHYHQYNPFQQQLSIFLSSSGISGGAIAGIIIGILVVALGAAILAFRLIQRRRRANKRLTGNLQAWTDRTSYFSATAGGAGMRGEREVEGGEVPFRDVADKDGGPWGMEEKGYQEPVLAGLEWDTRSMGSTEQAYQPYEQQQAYPSEYQQQQQQAYEPEYQQPQQFYHPYPEQQPYDQSFTPHTPTHQTQPQGYPYTPSAVAKSPDAYSATPSPVATTSPVPAQAVSSGSTLQDGMTVIVRQGFVRTLEDELVIAPGDNLTVVQTYDDGWCLCQSSLNEQGVVPQSCLEPISPFAEQGRTSPIQMPVPAVVVSDGNDEVLAGEEEKKLPSLPRSETTKSLAVSERSERRSSLFLNAAAAGLFLQQQAAMQAPQ
ncbi:hypothetical protein QFC20_004183 [Naganishia adeliensis]|uniref:Uncharacterized protein n=1 Tax=Naganishia adeliensis TaxID=92952 RepID=A0ACC2W2C2_9TREE|nr:hypothetical protein QFC20_004183 [Naganishia adeliensis]